MIRNKIILIISIISLILGCKNNNMDKPKSYKWDVEGGAPKNYPGVFYYADFIYEGGSKSVPAGAAGYQNGWGWGGRSRTERPSPLPHRLIAVWVSTTEKQAYLGDFELDTVKIKEIFEKGEININRDDRATNHNFTFKVSTAPGGVLAVWLEGILSQVEVGYYKGTKTNKITYKDLAPQGIDQTLEEYCQSFIDEDLSPEIQQQLATTGPPFGLWDSYRKKYTWHTTGLKDKKLIGIEYYYYNGEKETIQLKEYNVNQPLQRALPYQGWLRWVTPEEKTYDADVFFNEESIFEAFKKTYEKEEDSASMVYDVNTVNNKTTIKVYLQNENIKTEIKTDSINVYRHPEK